MPVKGMRDFPPEDMILRNKVFSTVRRVFEKYGFEPFETPAIELAKTLKEKYGDEEKLIYEFEDKGGRMLALRYDQTVPLVRYIVENPEIAKPFRRYVIGKAWRAEDVKKGRYREFYQCDIDIVGAKSILADAEVVACALETISKLKLKDVLLKINNRKILSAIIKYAGVKNEDSLQVIRTIDKLDKLGEDGVKAELEKSIGKDAAEKIIDTISISGSPEEVIEKAKEIIGDSKDGNEGLEEIKELTNYLKEFGVKNFKVDLSLARGLDYYTGNIFEAVSTANQIGSVMGGGRYDTLISRLSDGKIDLPAVGISLGIERIIELIKDSKIIETKKSVADVYVLPLGDVIKDAISIAQKIRSNNINCELGLATKGISKQLEYASNKGIPKVVIVGAKDLAEGKVTVKDMKSGKDEKVNVNDVLKVIQ